MLTFSPKKRREKNNLTILLRLLLLLWDVFIFIIRLYFANKIKKYEPAEYMGVSRARQTQSIDSAPNVINILSCGRHEKMLSSTRNSSILVRLQFIGGKVT